MSDPTALSASELAAAFAARALSPVELAKALLARIDLADGELHVFVTLDREGALRAARDAEGEIFAGRRRGPLHGVPVGVKDIIDVAGLPTGCNSRLRHGHLARTDADVVARLRAAGAIILGKVATHEWALGGPDFEGPAPPARNPLDPSRHPGGSSSGSGAGLAAGFFPLALGTDTGGSIRHPAAACGVVGLKPSFGLVPRGGVVPLAPSLDTIGPMARTVQDVSLLFDAIAGPRQAMASGRDGSIAGLRIGFVRSFHERDIPDPDPAVRAALERAATTLEEAGARVVPVDLPSLSDFAAANRAILTAEAFAIHASGLRTCPEAYGALSRRRMLVGAFLTAEDLLAAHRRRRELTAAVDAAFEEVDILLTANNMDPPCRMDDEAAMARNYGRQARTPFNLTGHPALALPCGLFVDGLSVSAQLVGPFGKEERVLRAGAALEGSRQAGRRA
jgi:aspartyl-tRNA(Asn)/glutamyl-tRNA(Gln) amidotransferase subunit A